MLFGYNGCIRAKFLYFGKMVVFGQKWLYSRKVVAFRQKWLYSDKFVVIGQEWLYSGKSGCIREKELVFGQGFFIQAKWLNLGKYGGTWANLLYWVNLVFFGKVACIWEKKFFRAKSVVIAKSGYIW